MKISEIDLKKHIKYFSDFESIFFISFFISFNFSLYFFPFSLKFFLETSITLIFINKEYLYLNINILDDFFEKYFQFTCSIINIIFINLFKINIFSISI